MFDGSVAIRSWMPRSSLARRVMGMRVAYSVRLYCSVVGEKHTLVSLSECETFVTIGGDVIAFLEIGWYTAVIR